MRQGVYPGSFNPPTRAHLAIARAAREQRNLDTVTLVVSRRAFDKEDVVVPPLDQRIEVIEASLVSEVGLMVTVTDDRLIADIAAGYDVVVMGADKWEQLHDLRYYASAAERDAALASLPELAIAPREAEMTVSIPAGAVLDIDPALSTVSSTRARSVEPALMTDAARASGWWA